VSASIDANILVYADNIRDPWHQQARTLVQRLAAGPDLLYLFWPTILGYLRIVTHPGILPSPIAPADAIANIDGMLRRPNVVTTAEGTGFWQTYLASGGAASRGNLVPDTHLAALLRANGVRVLYTRDSGFRRFEFLEVRDPFSHRLSEGTS
jgi:toxin-antitoxin system PIN domain toxin